MWPNFTAAGSNFSGDPAGLKLANAQLITVAFVPRGAPIPKPSASTIAAMQQAISASQNPPTTTPTTPTSIPSTSSTTAPSSTSVDDLRLHRRHVLEHHEQVRAVVLVGGEGTRLRPLTYTTPKQMLPVVEVPMIERVLAHLGRPRASTRRSSPSATGPTPSSPPIPTRTAAGVGSSYAVEPEPLDTAGAIRFAAAHAGVSTRPSSWSTATCSPTSTSPPLVAFHRRTGREATINLTAVEDPSRFGVVPTDADGRVLAFVEKPPPGEAPTNLINAGTYVLEPVVLDRIPDRAAGVDRARDLPGPGRRRALYASASDAYWLDTGTPAAYLQAHADLLDGTPAGPARPRRAELAGAGMGARRPVDRRRRRRPAPWSGRAPSSLGRGHGASQRRRAPARHRRRRRRRRARSSSPAPGVGAGAVGRRARSSGPVRCSARAAWSRR